MPRPKAGASARPSLGGRAFLRLCDPEPGAAQGFAPGFRIRPLQGRDDRLELAGRSPPMAPGATLIPRLHP
jgi:hypothetical protein